jgi:hypothetical protein
MKKQVHDQMHPEQVMAVDRQSTVDDENDNAGGGERGDGTQRRPRPSAATEPDQQPETDRVKGRVWDG